MKLFCYKSTKTKLWFLLSGLVAGWYLLTPIFQVQQVQANVCQERYDCSIQDQEQDEYLRCLANQKSCLEEQLDNVRSQQVTLTNTISLINGQISIQELQIAQLEAEIIQLENEIETLSDRISGLGVSLDRLSVMLVDRVKSHYKHSRLSPLALFLSAESFNQFLTQYRYLRQASEQTALAMERAENQRITYDEQRSLKEEKQEQVVEKRARLEAERAELDRQRREQQQLLEVTRNDERRFQQLIAEAERQMTAFRRFVTIRGGASLLDNQTRCDDWGCYYSQRDSKWGQMAIGASQSSMAEYGCLVASMAMVASYYNRDLTPNVIAASTNPFFLQTAYMIQGTWTAGGVTMTRTRVGWGLSTLDNELAQGRPVIVGIGAGPDHFVVIKEKKNGDYIMHDPFVKDGHDLKFSDQYTLGSITAVDRVRVN